jgi:hypothetical protein
MVRSLRDRAEWVADQSFACLREKIEGGSINVGNEASLQLQLASIIKNLGELVTARPSERFYIELEKNVINSEALFQKSGSRRAKIDIWYCLENLQDETIYRVAMELKYFKRENHREPNNRADVFKDIRNLENYGEHVEAGFMLVFTDHEHYVSNAEYSADTADFDFRHGRHYAANTVLTYRTNTPYLAPISLQGDYHFSWITVDGGLSALKLAVSPHLVPIE